MSILINGMEMPKSCCDCFAEQRIGSDFGCGVIGFEDGNTTCFTRERRKDCPLVEVPEQMKWIPVTERLPEENGKYLTVFTVNTIPPRPVIEVSCYAKDLYKIDKYDFQDKKKKSGFYQYDSEWGYFEMSDISHWMPLPQPPESDGEC